MKANIVRVVPQQTAGKITILPVEAHYSKRKVSNGFSHRLWNNLIERLKSEPDTYVIFPGDIIDADRPSLRDRKAVMFSESERISAKCEEDDYHRYFLEKNIIEELKPVKHKILGIVDGDHFVLYQNGRTSTQHICDTLGIPDAYIGRRMGWVVLNIQRKTNLKDVVKVKIFVRHGKGAYSNIGGDINGLIRQSTGFVADLYIGGHTHKKWVHSVPYLDVNKLGNIVEKPVGYARAGSLLRGFMEGQITYPEEMELNPLHIGYPDIYLNTGFHNDNIILKEIRGLG